MRGAKSLVSSAVMICIFSMASIVDAKSVFAVASHSNSKVKAYLINSDQIDRQATIKDTESFEDGATGFCVWPEKQRMFVTYEDSPVISWASTKTLSRDPDTDEFNTGVSNLAGMAVDEAKSFLYVLTRSGGHLYTYIYDENENTLYLIPPFDPCYPESEYRELEGIYGAAYDLALDEERGLCYVSDGSKTVRYYDTTDWALEGSINMGQKVAGMGIDPNNYLYAGYFIGGSGHNYLIRYYLNGAPNDPETIIKKDMGHIIMDIAVDSAGGLIYTTTDNTEYGTSGTVEVYDVSDCTPSDANYIILTDTEYDSDFNGDKPAGIAIGPPYKPPAIGVSKVDDVNDDPNFVTCILPDDEITYTIIIDPCGLDHEWVTVIDYLPKDVVFSGSDPNYDPQKHSYTWQLGGLSATDEPVVLEITVTVIEAIEPTEILVNTVSAESDHAYKETTEETPVCCFGGDIIYVDCTVSDPNNGTSWELAYGNLQDALARAEKGCGSEIWVAAGIYSPGDYPTNTFNIPDGVVVYGGLSGDEDPVSYDPNGREIIKYQSVLTGNHVNNDVVTMGRSTKLHGFVVEEAYRWGIKGDYVDFTVERCTIQNINDTGIDCSYGNLTVNWCVIRDNTNDGIYSTGSGKTLRINNCKIFDNGENGIYSYYSIPTIKNSEINHNGWDNDYDYDNGIRIDWPSVAGAVRNCTVFRNEGHGIYFEGMSANKPDIRNCIFYNNNYHDDLTQFYGGLTAHYSNVTDPADPNSTDCTKYGDNNIKCDPEFAYININDHNLHLHPDSPCVDAGDPCDTYDGELDIDGDDRVLNGDDYTPDNGRVDIGADEVACDDIYNPLDWNIDAIVNIEELIVLANAWLSDPCADNWDYRCDLDSDNFVNLVDFAAFGIEWLWQACWRESGAGMWMMGMGGGGESMPALVYPEFMEGSGVEGLMAETTPFMLATQQEESSKPSEPTIEEQIEQIKSLLDSLYEIAGEVDEDAWLNLVTVLEEMLKELEAN